MEGNNSIQIIATIGGTFTSKSSDLYIRLMKKGVTCFRFNLSKCCNVEEIEKRCEYIRSIQEMCGPDSRIMLDLPIPRRKPRITLNNNVEIFLKPGDIFRISPVGIPTLDNVNYIDDPNILDHLVEGVRVYYSDGECCFCVSEIDRRNKIITLKAQNASTIYTRKSISYGYQIEDRSYESHYFDAINLINPESVALSFVNTVQDIVSIKKRCEKRNINIISKIETKEAVSNLEDILDITDVMVARGDLLLNVDLVDFYSTHTSILDMTARYNRRLYVATGILPTLIHRSLPTHSELIDLGEIIKYNPYAIILNADLIHGEYVETAIDLIRNLTMN